MRNARDSNFVKPRDVEMKGLVSVSVREIHNTSMWHPRSA